MNEGTVEKEKAAAPVVAVVLLSLGLALNLIYCNFMGHATSFFPSASGFSQIMNPRVLFLSGICLISLLFVALPGTLRHYDRNLKLVVPLAASCGTVLYGLAYHQSLFDPALLTVVGLLAAGIGYAWIVSRFNLMIVRVLGVHQVVLTTTIALIIMLVVSALMPFMPDSNIQIVIAMALPLVAATLFEVSRMYLAKNCSLDVLSEEVPTKTTFGIVTMAKPLDSSTIDRASLLVLLVAISLFLAIVRALGAYGVWQGSMIESAVSVVFALPNILLISLVLIAFAYVAIIRMEKYRLEIRYIPVFAIIIGGLFVVLLQIDSPFIPAFFYNNSLLQADVCTHLLFWTVVGSCVEQLRIPSYRVIGVSGAIYSFVSLVWVFLLSNTNLVNQSFVTVTTYALLVIVLIAIWMMIKKSLGSGEGKAAASLSALSENPIEMISAQCEVVADDHKLSPREKEVFMLLAQGRTRNYISEELVLSINTVKTHIAHIYSKLGVADRQEMMSLIWSYDHHAIK